MKRRIIFHDPRLATTAGGGETLTLRKVDVLDRDMFDITILTRKGITSPLLLGFLRQHPHVKLREIEAPEIGCSDAVNQLLQTHCGADLWGQDRLVDDGIRFNSAAVPFYCEEKWDLASVSFLTDLFGLELHGPAAFHIYGSVPTQMAEAEGPLLRHATAVSAVSRYARDEFCSVLVGFIEAKQIEILSPGIPPAFFSPRTAKAARNVDFVYAGRLVERKGVDLIVRALHDLRSVHGSRPTVACAGDGPLKANLMNLCDELELTDQVSFPGALSQDQLIALLDRARCFLYPVRRPEAFGLAPLEAMARGVPAIVSDLGGMSDYMERSRNGVVLQDPSVNLLATAMLDSYRDPSTPTRFATDCVATARRYSWDGFTDAVNAFYRKACQSVQ